jgi:dihydrofolate reductase
MRVSLVAALAENRVIGRDGRLPWRIRGELARFKALTMGKPVIMGRKTFASIGKPLPGRPNIVISRDLGLRIDGARVVHGLDAALTEAAAIAGPGGEAMVIGGAEIYALALPVAARLYLTQVHAAIAGDTRFPEFEAADWGETSRELVETEGAAVPNYSLVVLDRIEAGSGRPPEGE